MKAKSRLQSAPSTVYPSDKARSAYFNRRNSFKPKLSLSSWRSFFSSSSTFVDRFILVLSSARRSFMRLYGQRFSLLLLSGIFVVIIVFVLSSLRPTFVAASPIYGLYLWLIIPFFCFNYYFWLFWLFKAHAALLWSISLTLLLFLRLQQVEMSISLVVLLIGLPIALEIIYRIINARGNSTKRYTRHPKRS